MIRLIRISAIVLVTFFISSCNKPGAGEERAPCCQKYPDNVSSGTHAKAAISENSIYQLPGKWTNAQGKATELKDLQGKIRLVAMIFTHCGYACPRMVSNLKSIQQDLPADLKNKVGFVLVSFDAERDHPERLKQYAADKGLDGAWTLLHGNADQVRNLSMLLNVQYDQLSDGSFNHSNILTVLDENGNIRRQLEGLDINIQNVSKIIRELAAR